MKLIAKKRQESNPIELSVIIPVHNAASHLDNLFKCLDMQQLTQAEMIFVENNSSDNSLELLERYAEKCLCSITVVSTQEKGSANARNIGIELCQGKYVIFIDADDEFAPNYFEKMISRIKAEKADICICGFNRIDAVTGKVFSPEMCVKKDINTAFINTALWNKIFTRECIGNTKLPGIRVCEDALFFYNLFKLDTKIVYIDEPLYHYYIRPNSVMNTIDSAQIKEILYEFQKFYLASEIESKMLMIYLHVGLSLPLGVAKCGGNYSRAITDVKAFLQNLDVKWYRDSALKLKNMGKITIKTLTLKCSMLALRYGMLKFLIKIYMLLERKSNKQIKW